MNAKYTPGPWVLTGRVHPVGDAGDETDLYCGSVYPEPWRGSVCSIQSADHIDGISREEAEANATLIAAAPDLLYALERIANGQEMVGEFTHADVVLRYQEIARAAIAKATGEQ